MSWNEKYDMDNREVWLYRVMMMAMIGVVLLVFIGAVGQVLTYYLSISCK